MILLGHGPSLFLSSRISTSSSPLTCPPPRVDFFVFRRHPLSLPLLLLSSPSPSLSFSPPRRKSNGGFLLFAPVLGLGRPTFPRGLLSPSPFLSSYPLTPFLPRGFSMNLFLDRSSLHPSFCFLRTRFLGSIIILFSFSLSFFSFFFFPTIILPCPPPCSRERQESSPERWEDRFIADGVAIRKRLRANSRDLNRMIRFWKETYLLGVSISNREKFELFLFLFSFFAKS